MCIPWSYVQDQAAIRASLKDEKSYSLSITAATAFECIGVR